ncbi:MAG: cytotoxic translational repressor of toxin-antitoxin stability system [Acidimicrobiaceae bacterium]|nr:cytotoxic translational repressor of toxin-antitoxin stability system [Acidimicrobiaceae bacterium]MXZ98597.1 cytotoxic translational repressor of toxin-antitoxin stability system [Acidimicrobiaceae bacterium]MYE75726.1 cytotoxic translational repressor of toxin-antitoxin stability system [Acidimicrobiaceae bacterium]MYE98285.1 cytotoxic translational repressor of toxin-antitoxin stability system [Acidimicrobiaceae bacterium]MYI54666.1 cytotoxic translational repressor of toxin-antitoxin sta
MDPRQRAVSYPAPTRRDHLRFCEIEGWTVVRSGTGKRSTHHETYELELPDGRILRTRISRPPDRTGYGAALWSHILRDQLQTSPDEFWQCVRTGEPPARSAQPAPQGAIPADLAHLLKNRVGLSDDQLAKMSRQAAVERAQQYWMTGK